MFFAVLALTPGPEPTALQAHSQASREEYGLVDHKRPYGLPQYDLMDLMVRDENVHFEEGMVGVSEGSSPEEEHQMPELNLTPLADLYIDQRASTTTSELSMRNESLLGLSAVHADGPVCPATLPHSERMLLTLHALPYRMPALGLQPRTSRKDSRRETGCSCTPRPPMSRQMARARCTRP